MRDSRPNIRPRRPERDSATTHPPSSSTWPLDRALAERWLPARSWQLPVRGGGPAPRHAQPPSRLPPRPVSSISCRVRSSCPFSPPLAAGCCVRCPRGLAAGLPFQDRMGSWGTYSGLMGRDSRELFCRQMPRGGGSKQTLTGSSHTRVCVHSHTHALASKEPEWTIKYRALNV